MGLRETVEDRIDRMRAEARVKAEKKRDQMVADAQRRYELQGETEEGDVRLRGRVELANKRFEREKTPLVERAAHAVSHGINLGAVAAYRATRAGVGIVGRGAVRVMDNANRAQQQPKVRKGRKRSYIPPAPDLSFNLGALPPGYGFNITPPRIGPLTIPKKSKKGAARPRREPWNNTPRF